MSWDPEARDNAEQVPQERPDDQQVARIWLRQRGSDDRQAVTGDAVGARELAPQKHSADEHPVIDSPPLYDDRHPDQADERADGTRAGFLRRHPFSGALGAPNLQALLLFRILQGVGGGGMVPVAQSILADAFRPEKRGQAFALFGVAVVVVPVVGPTLGGPISDNWSWQWCSLINAPVGVLAMTLIEVLLREPKRQLSQQQDYGFDVIGFVLVATFLGALEVVLDRGLEDDWFASTFIATFTIICVLTFLLMIPREMSHRNPMIDLKMVATRASSAPASW
jgi:hypothetical protein